MRIAHFLICLRNKSEIKQKFFSSKSVHWEIWFKSPNLSYQFLPI